MGFVSRAVLWPRARSQPCEAHFDPRAPSKSLIPSTGATRSRTSSTSIQWRPLCARSWPTERSGREAHSTFCRSAPTGLAGRKTPRALAGRLRRAQTFLRTLGIEIVFGREGRLGTRTIRITAVGDSRCQNTVSAVSRVSHNGPWANQNHPAPGMEQVL
jgi:hypothetical protein